MKEKISFILFSMLMIIGVHATEWYSYNTINTAFPSNPYQIIQIDQAGNKWIGSQYKGVYKYDGTNWEVFNTENSEIPSNLIKYLKFDYQDNLWICTSEGGLAKVSPSGEWNILNATTTSLPVNDVNWISFDGFGNKWIATRNGLALLDNTDSWTVYNNLNSPLISNEITTIAYESFHENNIKWIGTADGLVRYDDNNWQVFTTSNSALTGNSILNIQIDKFHTKWISIYNPNAGLGGGLVKIDSSGVWTVFTKANSSIPSNIVYSIACDSLDIQNPVWVTTDNGIGKLTGTAWTVYNYENTQQGLVSNSVFSMALEGTTKWFGTDKVMVKLASNVWSSYSILNSGIPDDRINTIYSHALSNKHIRWIGTVSGLSRFDGTNWTVYNMANSPLPSNDILSVVSDNYNNIWIGCNPFQSIGGGLSSYNPSTGEWQVYTTANSELPTNNISSIVVDSNNNKWIGTKGGGLIKLTSGNEWYIYNDSNSGISSNNINSILIDKDQSLWISTDYGVSNYNQTTDIWTVYNMYNSPLPSNIIKKVKKLENSNELWIVTSNALARKIGESWTIFNSSNSGLTTNTINDIIFDSGNYKWISTNAGMYRTDGITWKLYSSPSSPLSSNNLTCLFNEGTSLGNNKWIGSVNNGVTLFTGDNPNLAPGINLHLMQHPYISNIVKIIASANLIIADSISISVNNIKQEIENLGSNLWFCQYSAIDNGGYTVKLRVKNASIDSTITRNLTITFLDAIQRKARSYDNKLSLEDEGNQEFCIQIFNEDNEDGDLVYRIETNHSSPESIKLQFDNKNFYYLVYYERNNQWEPLSTWQDKKQMILNYAGEGKYLFKKTGIIKPIFHVNAYPNPFNPAITLKIVSDQQKLEPNICVEVFNIKGQKVKELSLNYQSEHEAQVVWDGTNQDKRKVSSGLYFYNMKNGMVNYKGKIILLK